MAEENPSEEAIQPETAQEPAPEPQAAAPGAGEQTATERLSAGQTAAPGPEAATAAPRSPEDLTGAERDQAEAFGLYKESLTHVDWGWKNKNGLERDHGHKSFILAEKAFITAGLYDDKLASKMWEDTAGRPPSTDLLKRLEDAKNADPRKGIADLTAGLGTLRENKSVLDDIQTKNLAERQLGAWEGAIGDAAERARSHRQRAGDELLKPEKPGQNDESGLEMFLRAIKSGHRAGQDMSISLAHGKKRRELEGKVLETRKEHGEVTGRIALFEQGKAVGMKDTVGPIGRQARRFPGAAGVVMSMYDQIRKRAGQGAANEAPAPEQTVAPGQDAGIQQAASGNARARAQSIMESMRGGGISR